MSIHDYHDEAGKHIGWRVCWREGGRQRERKLRRSEGWKKRQVELFESELRRKKAHGMPAIDSRVTVEQLRDRWWRTHVEPHTKPGTRRFYDRHWRLRIKPHLGHLRAGAIDRRRIAEFTADLSREGVPAATINDTLDTLRAVMGVGVEWGIIAGNPVLKARRPKQEKKLVDVLTPGQVGKLAAKAKLHRDAAMIVVAAFTGTRWGEVAALKWSDVRDDHIRLERAIDSDTGDIGSLKSHAQRSVPMFSVVREALEQWRSDPDWDGRFAGVEWVFPSARGTHLSHGSWADRYWRPTRKAAGFPTLRFHDLRHTFASLVIAEGATPLQVKHWLGHSTVNITFDLYGHLLERNAEAVAERIDALTVGAANILPTHSGQ